MHRTLYLLTLAALVGCGGSASPTSDVSSSGEALARGEDHEEIESGDRGHPGWDRQSLLSADRLLIESIARRGPADGLRPFLAHDATYLAPRLAIATGEKEVEAALAAAFPAGAQVAQAWQQFGGDVSADGLLGYTFGHGIQSTTQPDGTVLEQVVLSIAVWRHHGRHWLLETYLWNLQRSEPGDPPPGFPLIDPGVSGTPRWGAPRRNAAEVLAADTAFAHLSVAQGYSIAFAAYVAPEGAQMASPIAWGGEAVASAFAGWEPVETLDWAPALARSTFSGDLGWSVGNALYTLRNPDGSVAFQSPSKYLTVWARQADGHWKYILDGGNGRPLTP